MAFNNLFTGNNATIGSGGYQMTNCSSCDFSLNQFTFNRGQQGAGLYLGQSNGTIDSCYFDNNTANAYGGALFLDTDSANVTSCTFDSNYAYLIGGGASMGSEAPVTLRTPFSPATLRGMQMGSTGMHGMA